MILIFLLFFCDVSLGKLQYYDTYTAKPKSLNDLRKHVKENNTFWCALEIDDKCKPDYWRLLDGSCNNLKAITRGATHTPFYRVLPAVYGEMNYIEWIPHCCTPKGRTDYMCTPNKVPNDDPVHRFSDIRCLNMTRPVSFQTSGCLPNNTTPERINTATPLMDLSNIYGSIRNMSLRARLNKGGLLKFEVKEGRVWPPSAIGLNAGVCRLNQLPKETRCHATPDDATNTLAGINLVAVWFWRQHNKIATELSKLNPCWDDDKLFYTARDINIAIAIQIYYYELLPVVMGRENLIRDNIITPTLGFRDFYNPQIIPQLSLEYPYVLRWVHLVQESTMKMYDTKGFYVKQFPMVNLTLRSGYFAVDNNIDYVTQGAFRQPSAKFDYIVDNDLTGIGLGPHQKSSDILTNDLAKGRYFGFPPYVKYREFCSGLPHKTWKDLEYLIDPEHLEKLKEIYKSPEDIDLMAGIWLERFIKRGWVPPTFYCLITDQLIRNMVTDRHFYERPNRPNAFTFEQLYEIRKASIARVLCDVGDTVTQIQPQAFLRIGPGNELYNCERIPKINLNAWKDITCEPHYQAFEKLYNNIYAEKLPDTPRF